MNQPYQIIHAKVLAGLSQLPSDSVHCVITSPPYWGLRDYGVEGQIGLEATPGEYIEVMVRVFREVRRVLHPAGTVWMNMGDSYVSDGGLNYSPRDPREGKLPSGWNNQNNQPNRPHALRKDGDRDPKRPASAASAVREGCKAQGVLKPKDMVMMPARLAMELQSDGWYIRSQIPWLKRNGMPSSVTDRPAAMIEYIYLLSKSEQYYYDKEAVRMPASSNSHARGNGVNPKAMGPNSRMRNIRNKQNRSFSAAVASVVTTRMRRDTDWFFSSVEEYQEGIFRGLMVDDESADPVASIVNPQPFCLEMCAGCQTIYAQSDFRKLPQDERSYRICTCGTVNWVSHFATFPERLVEPMVLAGTSERGCCPECGAPWVRKIDKQLQGDWHPNGTRKYAPGAVNGIVKPSASRKSERLDPDAWHFSSNRMNQSTARSRRAATALTLRRRPGRRSPAIELRIWRQSRQSIRRAGNGRLGTVLFAPAIPLRSRSVCCARPVQRERTDRTRRSEARPEVHRH